MRGCPSGIRAGHVHVALGRYVARGAIGRAWEHGFFWIKLIGDLPVGSGSRREARVVASYLAKYVSKSFEDRRPAGLHRYEVAQGFQPEKVLVYGCSAEDVIRTRVHLYGSAGAGLVVVVGGGVAWAARLLGAVGLTT